MLSLSLHCHTEKEAGVQVLHLASLASECGMDGVVASANEAKTIKDTIRGDSFEVATPGIRPAGSGDDDQSRVATPNFAINSGSDYLVVGRPIMNAADRSAAAQSIINEMAGEGLA